MGKMKEALSDFSRSIFKKPANLFGHWKGSSGPSYPAETVIPKIPYKPVDTSGRIYIPPFGKVDPNSALQIRIYTVHERTAEAMERSVRFYYGRYLSEDEAKLDIAKRGGDLSRYVIVDEIVSIEDRQKISKEERRKLIEAFWRFDINRKP